MRPCIAWWLSWAIMAGVAFAGEAEKPRPGTAKPAATQAEGKAPAGQADQAEPALGKGEQLKPRPAKGDESKSKSAKADAGKSAKGKAAEKDLERLDAWADKIVYEGGAGKFVFTGPVTVIKGTLRVDSQDMEGTVDPKTRQVTRVVATGDVQLLTVAEVSIQGTGHPTTQAIAADAWRASCGKAIYDLKEDRIEMTALPGKPRPRLWRDKGYSEADKIVFFPERGEYELIGDPVIRGEMPTGPPTGPAKAPAPETGPR